MTSSVVELTHSVDGEIKVVDLAVLAEDLVQVVFVDVLGQALDDNLIAPWLVRFTIYYVEGRLALVDFF